LKILIENISHTLKFPGRARGFIHFWGESNGIIKRNTI
jgi:hypothetical protein